MDLPIPIADIALFANALISLVLTILVFKSHSRRLVRISLSIFLLIVAAWPATIAGFRLSDTYGQALFWDMGIYIIACFVPSSFLFFTLSLIKKGTIPTYFKIIGPISSLIFIALLFFSPWWVQNIDLSPIKSVTLGPAYTAWVIYYLAFMSLSLILLLRHLRRTTGLVKTQTGFILLSMAFPIVGATVPNIFLPLFGIYQYIHIGPFTLTIMSAIITYSIIKHRLFDIHLLIARTISYTVVLITTFAFYVFSLLNIARFIPQLNLQPNQPIPLAIIIIIASLTFAPIKKLIEKLTDKVFYKNQYDSQKLLQELSQTLASTLTISTLSFKIIEILVPKFRIAHATLVLKKDNKIFTSRFPTNTKVSISATEYNLLSSGSDLLIYDEIPEGKEKELLRQNDVSVVFQLKTKKHLLGMLLLGPKSSGDPYFEKDIDTLSIFAPELSIAVQNAQRFEEISDFNIVLQQKIKEATTDLKTANSRLKQLDKLKDEFISITSHELRTPMTAIKGYLWLALNKNKLPKKLHDDLSRAYISTERTITLVNDMLDVSRIEGGRIEINPDEFDIKKLATEVTKELESKTLEKKLTISVESTVNDSKVVADPEKIRRVLVNLIGNSIKFTPNSGQISVNISRDDGHLITAVSDTGVGIKKDDLTKLFVKFGRLDNSYSGVSEQPGTGLGLYITKNIIELSGGEVSVQSTVGKGTTFTFTLPTSKPTDKPKKSRSKKPLT